MNDANKQTLKYSAKNISPQLLDEIQAAFSLIRSYGSIEIYVQNSVVTQITVRNIKKTSVGIPGVNKE
jgi:hypothetical protein